MTRLHLFMIFGLALAAVDVSAVAQPRGRSCDHRNGPFAWSCDGPVSGMSCTHIIEVADPDSWNDNYFCAATDMGFRWSSSSPVPGLRCTHVVESADPHTWSDNYFCVPQSSPYQFRWSSNGPIAGQQCVQWDEPADSNSWSDNFLCWTRAEAPARVNRERLED